MEEKKKAMGDVAEREDLKNRHGKQERLKGGVGGRAESNRQQDGEGGLRSEGRGAGKTERWRKKQSHNTLQCQEGRS